MIEEERRRIYGRIKPMNDPQPPKSGCLWVAIIAAFAIMLYLLVGV